MDLPALAFACKACHPLACDDPSHGPAALVQGRNYDDSNPFGLSCTSPQCRAAGDCYCPD